MQEAESGEEEHHRSEAEEEQQEEGEEDEDEEEEDEEDEEEGGHETCVGRMHKGTGLSGQKLVQCVEAKLDSGLKLNAVAAALGFHRNTLWRRLRAAGWKGVYHKLSVDGLREVISQDVEPGDKRGIRAVKAALKQKHLRVSIGRVRNALYAHPPRKKALSARQIEQHQRKEQQELWKELVKVRASHASLEEENRALEGKVAALDTKARQLRQHLCSDQGYVKLMATISELDQQLRQELN